MSVRAKFNCETKVPSTTDGSIVDVTFRAVYGDGTDNAEWSKWTPCGTLQMQITNPAAHEQLVVGRSYFIDITAVE